MHLSLLYKYQPKNLDEFEINNNLKQLLKTLIKMDSLNILFTGDSGSGKTCLINAMINEYYSNNSYSHIDIYLQIKDIILYF